MSTWPATVALKPCCGEVLTNEDCDCQALLEELKQAPVIVFTRRDA